MLFSRCFSVCFCCLIALCCAFFCVLLVILSSFYSCISLLHVIISVLYLRFCVFSVFLIFPLCVCVCVCACACACVCVCVPSRVYHGLSLRNKVHSQYRFWKLLTYESCNVKKLSKYATFWRETSCFAYVRESRFHMLVINCYNVPVDRKVSHCCSYSFTILTCGMKHNCVASVTFKYWGDYEKLWIFM
jgi:hypothetical protein